MHETLKVSAILWAWGCWAWAAYSHQWFWLAISLVPYLALNWLDHPDQHKE